MFLKSLESKKANKILQQWFYGLFQDNLVELVLEEINHVDPHYQYSTLSSTPQNGPEQKCRH